MVRFAPPALLLAACLLQSGSPEGRRPAGDADLRFWLENMILDHGYSEEEVSAATGLTPAEIAAAVRRWAIVEKPRPPQPPDAPRRVLPYPGGRHPRIGFLEGAVRPQRETKASVFAPWGGYAVVDLPEAVWSNLGLTYLAHTHVPTLWTRQGVELPRLEWDRRPDGSLESRRALPNGIAFGARVVPSGRAVRLELWLTNGTKERLTDLRAQVCVLLRGSPDFSPQTNDNKVFSGRYAACRDDSGTRWLVTAWDPLHRAWANPPCPCLHADPKLPDCAPGQTVRAKGWLSFYEGRDLEGEIARIEATGWRSGPSLRGEVVDAETGRPVASRLYVQGGDGRWHHATSEGSAVPYRKERGRSVEVHTSLSAHAFALDLPPGTYTVAAERGKEYLPASRTVTIGDKPVDVRLSLERWIDMARLGWYSGETHVHRPPEELPTLMLAEDLNVAFPLVHWVTRAFAAPPRPEGAIEARPVAVDATHVFWPRNTEYEIFTVGDRRHTLGAFFAINHRAPLQEGVPPVGPVARKARAEGALIEIDKHNWPWSMALVPVMPVDLYELANNHLWRTEFGFPAFGEAPADYMGVERDEKGFTERGWIEFGFRNYYALLDCGFRLRPTAGSASGVHPVPLGFGRVYVELEKFGYEEWVRGLDAGRSFVTTGPMLLVRLNDRPPGHVFPNGGEFRLGGAAVSERPLARLEIVVNGAVVRSIVPANRPTDRKAHESPIDEKLEVAGSSWIAVRCFEERPGGRVRFAHTGPFHVEVAGRPLRPRRVEVEYLVKRVEDELARSEKLLPPPALDEYREALRIYRALLETAR